MIGWDVNLQGWCVVRGRIREVIAGPFATHQEAVEAVQTRAFRLAQGWKP